MVKVRVTVKMTMTKNLTAPDKKFSSFILASNVNELHFINEN